VPKSGGEISRKVVVLATIHDVQGAENGRRGSCEDPEFRGAIEALIMHYYFTASIQLDGSRVYQVEGLNRTVEASLAASC